MKKVLTSLDKLSKWRENAPLVSFIIPVYNTPIRYLRRCLDSVVTQTYRNLEIIIVDDGSTSEVVDVLKEYQVRDPRIQILSGEHQGVSAARNLGMEQMNGEFFTFVDADDEISAHFIQEAVFIAQISYAEVIVGKVQPLYQGTQKEKNGDELSFQVTQSTKERDDIAREMLSGYSLKHKTTPTIHGRSLGAKVYSTRAIRKLNFDMKITISEDTIFNYLAMRQVNSIAMAERTWYYYYQFGFSASHQFDVEKFSSSLQEIAKYQEGEHFSLDYRARALYQLVSCMNNAISIHDKVRARSVTQDVIAMGNQFFAYDPEIFAQYSIKPWVRLLALLAKRNRITLLLFYWWAFVGIKQRLKKRSLFTTEGREV